MRVAGLALAVLCASCRCGAPEVEPVPAFVRVAPTQIDFGRVFVGSASSRGVEIINEGRAPLEGTWALTGAAFFSDDSVPTRALVGSNFMAVRCAPETVGVFDGVLTISLSGFEPIRVPLACEGIAVPECPSPGPCRVATWNTATSRCVESAQPDGTDCSSGDVCLVDALCNAGRCEGRLTNCEDADPCTSDTCHPQRGCEHAATVQCPGEGACRVGQCAAGVGCGLVDAIDGTPCGPSRTCTLADVCIAGACVQRDPPDGFTCSANGPCGGEGRCVNDQCIVGASSTVRPSWSAGSIVYDGGVDEAWSDLYAHRDGGLTLSSYFLTPARLSADSPTPVQLSQSSRRCISWLGWDVCGDLPALRNSPISAIDVRSGQTVWTYGNGFTDIAEFSAPRTEFFTARLAVMNENELLVLYESRTLGTDGTDPRCRTFAMIVVDRQGQHLRSRFLDDPIFSTCDHPHSYGVAVDAQSNIYLAFTPSSVDNPAISVQGTTIFSYSPALQLRWRRFMSGLVGGELSVGDGVLFQERSAEVLSTQTGATRAMLPGPFGLGVIGDGFAVAASAGDFTLRTVSTSNVMPGWQRTLSGAQSRAPLAVATWQSPWGPRDVALAFTQQGSAIRLEATELLTGARAFECPVDLPELPLMTSTTPGGIAVMMGGNPLYAGWSRCDECDPKYARTRSQFAWLPLPGLTPATVPWSGGWGNEGHTHHEGR